LTCNLTKREFEAIPSLPADFEKFKRRKKCPVPLLKERNGKACFLPVSSKGVAHKLLDVCLKMWGHIG
jgi:hypothetical protein